MRLEPAEREVGRYGSFEGLAFLHLIINVTADSILLKIHQAYYNQHLFYF